MCDTVYVLYVIKNYLFKNYLAVLKVYDKFDVVTLTTIQAKLIQNNNEDGHISVCLSMTLTICF